MRLTCNIRINNTLGCISIECIINDRYVCCFTIGVSIQCDVYDTVRGTHCTYCTY